MSSIHLVDPELAPLLETMPPLILTDETLHSVREDFRDMAMSAMGADEENLEVRELRVPGAGDAPAVRMLAYRPRRSEGPLPAMLHIHGGGYVMGCPELNDMANRKLVRELGCAVYSVDYRLAPETRFPGALEDCYAALRWLFDNAEKEGLDAGRIGLKGESAGGGLAAATALFARDRQEVNLAFQCLECPMLDDRTVDNDVSQFSGEFMWTRASNAFGWAALLGPRPGDADISFYAAPARAENLSHLPATFISVGALDLFLDEDLTYARRLAHAGIPIELHVYPGGFHGFELVEQARITQAASRASMGWLRRMIHG